MGKELSLKHISDIWQRASVATENYRASIPQEGSVFNLAIDENGRAYLFFADTKGKPLAIEEIMSDNSPLGLALERIKQQRVRYVSCGLAK